tara:strand:- start:44 stop:316 length:273 start_codon:yes stop_codon:yes gene_type:complete
MPDWVWLVMAIVGGVVTTLAERRGKKKAADVAARLTRQLDAVIHGVERAGIGNPATASQTKFKIKKEAQALGVERDLRARVKRLTEELQK